MNAGDMIRDALLALRELIEQLRDFPSDDAAAYSYRGRAFTIESSDARVRNDDLTERTYAPGDPMPPGASVGDPVRIAQGTVVQVTDTKVQPGSDVEANGTLFVNVEEYGWTAARNLSGGFRSETFGIRHPIWTSKDPAHKTVGDADCKLRTETGPTYVERKPRRTVSRGAIVTIEDESDDGTFVQIAEEDGAIIGWTNKNNLESSPPAGKRANVRTVKSSDARIRDRVMDYQLSSAAPLPQGTFVIVKGKGTGAHNERYVLVAEAVRQGAAYVEGVVLGWTAAGNLVDGWADCRGSNAAWKKGNYVGQLTLIDIQGTDGPETLARDILAHYLRLLQASTTDEVILTINDGFRTYAKQVSLYQKICVEQGDCSKVALPGRSNHQNGIAVDLSTGGFDTAIYAWLKKHAPRHGWTRTVDKEAWHWEYRPADARKHGHKLPNVSP